MISRCTPQSGSVIEDFYEAENWDQKKQFIYDSEGIDENFLYTTYHNFSIVSIINIEKEKIISDTLIIYKVNLKGLNRNYSEEFLVRTVNGIEKIDFKGIMGYNLPNLAEIRLKGINTIDELKVKVSLITDQVYFLKSLAWAHYYTWDIRDYSDNGPAYLLLVRGTPEGEQLFNLTKSGGYYQITLLGLNNMANDGRLIFKANGYKPYWY